ncbi:restriction endonuclease [Salisaeta longa]|uniref:restriction endonuclease n=1 Tax=Salisaeta longa TaxID=503170 RepID=UPI0003B50C0A|nr:restriction endonuclease [Salisaeta longa]
MGGNKEFHVDDWREYENEIYGHLVQEYSGFSHAEVKRDVRIEGAISGRKRQVDILLIEDIEGEKIQTAYDAKFHSRPIDLKHVESFLGMLKDIQVNRGVLVSKEGYTSSAYKRVFHDERDLDLDIWSLDEFKSWQAAGAIPYAGDAAVILPAPMGWTVDINNNQPAPGLARLFRRGLTFEEALQIPEFAYVQLWNRQHRIDDLDKLLRFQKQEILSVQPEAEFSYEEINSNSGPPVRRLVRRVETPAYPSAEITGFAEFGHFIFFIVLFSELHYERRNIRKIKHLLKRIVPLTVHHDSNQSDHAG